MPENNRHIIHNQVIELELSSQNGAWEWQQKASRLFQQEVQQALANHFDQLAGLEDIIRIETLEIDLGNIAPDHFDRIFPEKCRQAIEKAVSKAVQDKSIINSKNNYKQLPFDQETKAYQEIKRSESILAAFFHFLSSGTLPWFARNVKLEELEEALLRTIELGEAPTREKFYKLCSTNAEVTERFVNQFSVDFVSACMESLWPEAVQSLEKFKQLVEKYFGATVLSNNLKRIRKSWWRIVLQGGKFSNADLIRLENHWKAILTRNGNASNQKKHFDLVWQQIMTSQNNILNLPVESFPSLKEHPITKKEKPADNEFSNREASLFQAIKNEQAKFRLDRQQDQNSYTSSDRQQDQNSYTSSDKQQDQNNYTSSDPQPDYFIDNAGLVIAAVYFKPLFQGLGWLEENQFIDQAMQERAIHLSQYLVNGEQNPPEFELPLNKILCGWPLENSLDRHIDLSDPAKKEAESLLNAIIQHWTMLGNSSIEALRNTFLQRNGKLTYESGMQQWILNVEKTGFDICVERLPWTISVIKLPWMTDKLIVDWV